MRITPKQITLGALLFAVVSAALTALVIYRQTLLNAVSIDRHFPFWVASSPSGADVLMDGKLIGTTPATMSIEPGQHIVELHKDGYESLSRAFYATYVPSKYRESIQELNVELRKQGTPTTVSPVTTPTASRPSPPAPQGERISPLVAKELRELRSMILANPEEAITVTAIQERMRVQADEIKGLKEDLKEIREQSKWFIGIAVAVVLGLLASVAAILQAFPKNAKV